MAWFLCDAACIAVVAVLTGRRRRTVHIVAGMIIAVIASFSSAQGLIVWAAGAGAIVLTQRRVAATLGIWLIAAVVTDAIYAHGLEPSSLGHFDIVHHPIEAMHYAFVYLGSPVAGWNGDVTSLGAGVLVFAILAASFIGDMYRPHRRRHLLRRGPWYALSAFPLASAVATATGRAGYGLEGALSSRYTSISGLAWIAAVCIGATYVTIERRRTALSQRSTIGALVAVTVLTIVLLRSELGGWRYWQRQEASWASARRGLENNDPAALGTLYPHRARIEMLIEELRHVRDGPFLNG